MRFALLAASSIAAMIPMHRSRVFEARRGTGAVSQIPSHPGIGAGDVPRLGVLWPACTV